MRHVKVMCLFLILTLFIFLLVAREVYAGAKGLILVATYGAGEKAETILSKIREEYENKLLIIITNPNSYVLQNYQVRVNLSSVASKLPRPFSIRTASGTVVPYCFEQSNGECSTSQTNTIWVKVPEIPAGGSIELKIESEGGPSTGGGIFDFYDDFTAGLSKWTVESGSACSQSSGQVKANVGYTCTLRANFTFNKGRAFEAYCSNFGTGGADDWSVNIMRDNTSWCGAMPCSGHSISYQGDWGPRIFIINNYSPITYIFAPVGWHLLTIMVTPDDKVFGSANYGQRMGNFPWNTSYTRLSIRMLTSSQPTTCEWARVRKIANSEVTVQVKQ